MKRAYGLTVDRREAAALERILRDCANTSMEPMVCRAAPASAGDTGRDAGGRDVLAQYDDNRSNSPGSIAGRVFCSSGSKRFKQGREWVVHMVQIRHFRVAKRNLSHAT